MATQFVPVYGLEGLDEWFERSQHEPVVLFNHDPWCPISSRAYREMEQVEGEVALIDVSRERAVTREIVRRTGVRHESPQVIVLRDGRSTWSASHFEIAAEEVEQAFRHNGDRRGPQPDPMPRFTGHDEAQPPDSLSQG